MYIYRRPETKSSLSNETPVTDANGEAQMTLTLESAASGTYRITASAPDREGGKELDEDVDYVRFNVIVGNSPSASQSITNTGPVPPESDPTVFFRILGDNQSGVVGEPLAKPFVVGDSRSGRRSAGRNSCNLQGSYRWRFIECHNLNEQRKRTDREYADPWQRARHQHCRSYCRRY